LNYRPRPPAPSLIRTSLRADANSPEPYMDGRLPLERINGPFHYEHKASPAEYGADLKRAIEQGWLTMHGCTYLHPSSGECQQPKLRSSPHRRVGAALAGR